MKSKSFEITFLCYQNTSIYLYDKLVKYFIFSLFCKMKSSDNSIYQTSSLKSKKMEFSSIVFFTFNINNEIVSKF